MLSAMIKIDAIVKNVEVYTTEDKAEVTLTFDKTFEGLRKIDGVVSKGEVDYVRFNRSFLVANLCDADDDVAFWRAIRDAAFGKRELGGILFKAKLSLEREFHPAGEVVNGVALAHDYYSTTIKKVVLSERAKKFIEAELAKD